MAFKKNVAVTGFCVGFIHKTTGDPVTTGTPTGTFTLDGGAQAAIAGAFVHEGNGLWSVDLLAAEMNGTIVGLTFSLTNAINAFFTIKTVLYDPDNATTLGLTNIDAAITSRMATYTQPTGFLAATFPAGTVANTTNITAGTITTVTTLTNLPAITANWLTAAGVADAAFDNATFAADTGLQSIRSGTAQAGAATTITLDAGASAVDSFYNNTLIVLTGGTGVGQCRFITAYVGATKVATVATWVTTPGATTTFAIRSFDAVAGASAPTAAQNATAVWDKARASHVTAGTFGEGAASVQGNVTGSVGSVTGAVGSVTGAVGSVTANVNAALANVAHGGAAATAQFGGAGGITATHTGNQTGSVGSVTGAVGSVTAGVTLAASAVQAIWDALTSALTTAGSIGKKIADWVIGTSQTGDAFARLGAPAGASVSADIAAAKVDTAAIKVKTDALPTDPADQSMVEAAILSAWTTAMTESYAANGATITPAQALYAIHQMLMQFSIAGTSLTVQRLNASTTAFVVTLDSATAPTQLDRV